MLAPGKVATSALADDDGKEQVGRTELIVEVGGADMGDWVGGNEHAGIGPGRLGWLKEPNGEDGIGRSKASEQYLSERSYDEKYRYGGKEK